MVKKMVFLLLFLALVGISILFSQEQKIQYVDIKKAQEQIEQLQSENDSMAGQNGELEAQNTELESSIEQLQTETNEIGIILARIRQKGTELHEIYNDIVDQEQKQRAQEAIQRNRDLRNQLEDKKEEQLKQLQDSREQVEENRQRIDINNRKTERNINTINFLNAAIESTKAQTARLNAYIDTVNSINNEAAKYLGDATSE